MTSANNKFRKTATVAGMAIAISAFSALPAAAQMADGQSVLTQLRIQTVQAPPSTLSPSDLERFKTLLREEQDRVKSSSWTLVEAQPGRIRLADLTENSEHIGKITARDLVLSGLRAEGGSFVIERAEMAGVNIVEKDGDYITAEDIVYGPINVSNSGLDNALVKALLAPAMRSAFRICRAPQKAKTRANPYLCQFGR